MRLQCRPTPRPIVDLDKTLEINANPASAQRQADGRRAGLKIRWGNTRVGSSPTFGTYCKVLNSVARSDGSMRLVPLRLKLRISPCIENPVAGVFDTPNDLGRLWRIASLSYAGC
jgi:hypothetical protein